MNIRKTVFASLIVLAMLLGTQQTIYAEYHTIDLGESGTMTYFVPEVNIDVAMEAIRRQIEEALREMRLEEFEQKIVAVDQDKIQNYYELDSLEIDMEPEDIMPTEKQIAVTGIITEAVGQTDSAEKLASDALLEYLDMTMNGQTPEETLQEYVDRVTKPKIDNGKIETTASSADDIALLEKEEIIKQKKQDTEKQNSASNDKKDSADNKDLKKFDEQLKEKPAISDEEVVEKVNEIIEGKSEKEQDKLFETMLDGMEETFDEVILDENMASDKLIEYLDKNGMSTKGISAARNVKDIQEIYEKTREIYDEYGRDAALGHLIFKTAGKTAKVVGGTYSGAVGAYMEVAAKMVETGSYVYTKAEVRSGYAKAGTNVGAGNQVLNKYGKISNDEAKLDVWLKGEKQTLNIACWKNLKINGKDAWVPCDENFEPYDCVFVTKPASGFSIFKSKEADVYEADVSKIDDEKIRLGEQGSYK